MSVGFVAVGSMGAAYPRVGGPHSVLPEYAPPGGAVLSGGASAPPPAPATSLKSIGQNLLAIGRSFFHLVDALLRYVCKELPIVVNRLKGIQVPGTGPSRLNSISQDELARLGATDKAAFFAALRPAAEETERRYGVPAAITLAQAALETGWGKHLAAPYNLFGMKGTGTAGSRRVQTQEYRNGHYETIYDSFAAFNNFSEAVEHHGKLFHNGYYDKALANYQRYHSVEQFAKDITGIYATSPVYANSLMALIRQYHL